MSSLTDEEISRYGRQIILPGFGAKGQRRLKEARVLVVGAGGLGSPALLYLAGAGIGHLGVIDGDNVDASNLHRQIAHSTSDVGRNKAHSAVETIRAINPLVEAVAHPKNLSADEALDLFADYDIVLDCSDNFPTRFLVNDACVMLRKPLVTAAILRYSGQICVIIPGQTACYRCLLPTIPPPGSVPPCSEAGIVGPVAGTMGALQALEAIKLLTGSKHSIAGKFILVDFLTLETQVLDVQRDPACGICSDHPTITALEQTTFSCSL